MNTHADKTQENKSQSVTNGIPRKQSSRDSTFQFVDNRPEVIAQRKLQEMANNRPNIKQAAQLQAMANNHSFLQEQPIQMILRNPANGAREAGLIQRYHEEENAGDRSRDHQAAIAHFRAAIDARRRVNALHVAADQGHLDAIGVLQGKIRGRENAIAEEERPSAQARARARRRNRNQEAAAEVPNPGAPVGPIGTEDQASWLPGNQPAWFPRSYGS